jgi:hypothetical protein
MNSIAVTAPRFTGRLAVFILLAISLHSTSGFALGTDDQRAACTPDVFGLCGSEIPNVDRIVACLKKEKPNLSKDCRAVFNTRPVRAAATGFLLTRENRWCLFGTGVHGAEQQNWVTWCGPAARRNR